MNYKPINLSSQDITSAEIDAVMEVMRSDRLSIGPRLDAFEAALAARVGRKYGIAVNSGTSGLHLCVKSLGIGKGDEVITTPFSFISTTNCLLFEDAVPVFVDIDPESYNMDPDAIEAAITPRTKAILPVEVFGNTAHFDAYEKIARRHDLLFIEDCCEAFGGSLNGRPAGSFGLCGVFGFYPNKQITTGEGGMIVTDREDIRDMCLSLRDQGRAPETAFGHERLGYNYRMSEITAAVGLVQVERLDEILTLRRTAAEMYNQALGDVEEIHIPPMADPETASWFVYVVRLADRFTQADRDAIIERLRGESIGCSDYFVPIHTQPYVTDRLGVSEGDFPLTEHLSARTIALPFFARITEEQIARIKVALVEAIASL